MNVDLILVLGTFTAVVCLAAIYIYKHRA